MSNMIIVRPKVTGWGTDSAGSGWTNLVTPDPKEVWAFGGAAATIPFYMAYPAPLLLDSFFIGFADVAPGAIWTVEGGLDNFLGVFGIYDQPLPAPSLVDAPRRKHGFARLPAPVLVNRVRFSIRFPAYPSGNTIGILLNGLATRTRRNREKGGGRTVIDTGSREALRGGGFGIGKGARKAGFRWTFGDLDDAELDQLHALAMEVGETDPIIVVEDPDVTSGLNERIHYGLFDRFDFYERGDPSKHRWAMSVTQWV